ncbi:hypothetical protein V2S84_17080 [Azotobacter chroococcum]|nr:hypothetical protein [Azotobacter chroococcum]
MSLLSSIKRLFGRPEQAELTKPEPQAVEPASAPDENFNPFSKVRCCFVPVAVITNTYDNLMLVGTRCYHGDETYRRLDSLKRENHLPAGSLLALNDDGSISSQFTWSDIGQLDYAFNDYLNFLIEFRGIYESDDSTKEKLEALEGLAARSGSGGHSHSVFVEKHGGIRSMLAKCSASDSAWNRPQWIEALTISSEDIMRGMGAWACVDEKPTFAFATTHKHDLEMMLRCCDAEESTYWSQPQGRRLCAAPSYFERVAILSRKAKDYAGEVTICERWERIINDYIAQPMVIDGRAALVHKGPRSIAILARLPKAKELLQKQKP